MHHRPETRNLAAADAVTDLVCRTNILYLLVECRSFDKTVFI